MHRFRLGVLLLPLVLACCIAAEQGRSHSELKAGMSREEVETKVADLLGAPRTYSPYGNSLPGGTLRYGDGDWVLEVVYKPGAPAPWVGAADGSTSIFSPLTRP